MLIWLRPIVGHFVAVSVFSICFVSALRFSPDLVADFHYDSDQFNDWRQAMETSSPLEVLLLLFVVFYPLTLLPTLILAVFAHKRRIQGIGFYIAAGFVVFAIMSHFYKGIGLIGIFGTLLASIFYWFTAGRYAGLRKPETP